MKEKHKNEMMKTAIKEFENMSERNAELYFETCAGLMNNEIWERVCCEILNDPYDSQYNGHCTRCLFLHRYRTLHFEKFGEDFIVD